MSSRSLSVCSDETSKLLLTKSDRRTIGLEDAGVDGPVMCLAWLFFSIPLLTFGLMSQAAVAYIGFVYCLAVAVILLVLTQDSLRWTAFGLYCSISAVAGFIIGTVLRQFSDVTISGKAVCLVFSISFLYLLFCLGTAAFLEDVKLSLVGSRADQIRRQAGVRPEVAKHMNFGVDKRMESGAELVGIVHPKFIAEGLLTNRCYWSGEPALDYAFFVANEHCFIGCLICHPVNAYEKWERILVLLILCPLIVFPVALFSTAITAPIARTVLILFLATVPRNLLKIILKKIVLVEERLVLNLRGDEEDDYLADSMAPTQFYDSVSQGGTAPGKEQKESTAVSAVPVPNNENQFRAATSKQVEIKFFVACFVLVGLTMIFCSAYLVYYGAPFGRTLLEASTGMVYAFILELVFEVVMPRKTEDGRWTIGFFGLWLAQKKAREAKNVSK